MAYYDAISNAIAARGNALAQAAQQQGQVYGNLASNLGQLPFQAMQAGQRRRAIEVETQQRAAQTQTIQNELDFQKEAYATMNRKDLSPEQLDMEMGNILKKFGKFQEFEALQSRKMQTAVNKYNVLKGGPGTPPPGGFALPEPTRGVTQPGMGVANAFAPVVPATQQMVNPEVDIPGIGTLRPPTAGEQEFQKQQSDRVASAVDEARQQRLQRSGIEGQKEVAKLQASLKPPPRDYLTSQRTRDPRSSTGWRWMQWDQEANEFSIPGNEAPVPPEIMAGMGTPTVLGTQGGNAVVFNPVKGGGGKVTTTPLPEGGPIRPKTAGPGEIGKTADIEASEQKIVNLKTMYNKDWVGPAQGRWNDWMMKVPGVAVDPKMAKFYAANTALENEVIKFITGAQMSEPESQRILRQVPTFRDKPEVWEAKYDQTLENVRIMKDKMRAAGFAFGEESSTPPAPTGGRTSGRRMSDKSDAELKKILGIQ